jgi:cell division protein FtsB
MRSSRRRQVEAKKKRRRLILSTLGILIVTYLTLTLVFGENGLLRYLELRSVKSEFEAEIRTIERQNEELKRQIEAIKEGKDPNLIEELAREQGLTKEGEIIFQYK